MTMDAQQWRDAGSHAIRVASFADAGAIAAIYAPYVIETPISFEIEPPSADEMARRMDRIGQRLPWLVYEDGGLVLGYAYASQHGERAAYGWSADATVYVARGAHRAGIGRALYDRLHTILRLQGFHSVFGGITLPNAASVGLHEACGYSPVGVYREVGYKLGAWHDVGWWGLRLNPPAPSPNPIQRFSQGVFDRAARLTPPAAAVSHARRGF